jgi:hypothetical protein
MLADGRRRSDAQEVCFWRLALAQGDGPRTSLAGRQWDDGALVQGSDDDVAWLLPTLQSGESNGDWLSDTDHAVEELDGDGDFAALSVG